MNTQNNKQTAWANASEKGDKIIEGMDTELPQQDKEELKTM